MIYYIHLFYQKDITVLQSNTEDIIQSNKKYFTKKVPKVKVEDDRKEYKKKKRLETYGITD